MQYVGAFSATKDVVPKDQHALKAPLASPAFTGTPTAPTAAPGTNTTQVATTAFVQQELAGAGAVSTFEVDGGSASSSFTGTLQVDFGGAA